MLGPSLKGEGVDNLLGNNYVGEDMPILNKGGLGLVNIIGEMRLQSFSNNLINNITEANRPEVLRQNRLHFLRNKSNTSLVHLWLHKS